MGKEVETISGTQLGKLLHLNTKEIKALAADGVLKQLSQRVYARDASITGYAMHMQTNQAAPTHYADGSLIEIECRSEDLAKLCGIGVATVSGLAREGVFKKRRDGAYLLLQSVTNYIQKMKDKSAKSSLDAHKGGKTYEEFLVLRLNRMEREGALLRKADVRAWLDKFCAFTQRTLSQLEPLIERSVPGIEPETMIEVKKAIADINNEIMTLRKTAREHTPDPNEIGKKPSKRAGTRKPSRAKR